ncbi:hypothetical protein QFZ40_001612 [Arthrobacter pascens]|uniref:hypothetical protein n=1 Tax=Arthrobacter pascens TaxID=1677 RepID=UPI00278A0F54|nr:hypothetical protein [Arthrobacter pascens]MDQ0633703.1 hypothetical protein [Arthrobacter pascens]
MAGESSTTNTPQFRLTALLIGLAGVIIGLVLALTDHSVVTQNATGPRFYFECGAPLRPDIVRMNMRDATGIGNIRADCTNEMLPWGIVAGILLIIGGICLIRWLYMMVGRTPSL